MTEQEQKIGINDYQPTAEEIAMLQKAGLTLEQLLQYDQPNARERENLQNAGMGLVQAMLQINLKGNIKDALNQVSAFLYPGFPQQDIEREIQEAQLHAKEVVTSYLEGNPYPGKDFSKAQGEQVLALMKDQTWSKTNLADCLTQIRRLIDPTKPKAKPKPNE